MGRSSGGTPQSTFELLDDIITALGSTSTSFWPFLESQDDNRDDYALYTYKESAHTATGNGDATEPFYPYRHSGGIFSVSFEAAENQYLSVPDNADFSFGSNAACSFGLFLLPRDITSVTLMAKYDDTGAAEDREWKLQLDGSSMFELEVYDDTNNHSRIGASDTALTLNEWESIVVTYSGADSDAAMTFYKAGVADGTGNTESNAAFASMVAGATIVTIGADVAASAQNEFSGRIALPFICGTELTAANALTYHTVGQRLLGLAS